MNELLSPITDLVKERNKIMTKKKLYEKFLEKPDWIQGHINKANVDIHHYTIAINALTEKLTDKEFELLEYDIKKINNGKW